jgi:hypothetical protein
MVENTTETAFAFGFRNKRPTAVAAAFSHWYFTTAARGHQPSANSITSCERPPVVRSTCRSTPLTIIFFLSFVLFFFFFLDFEEIAIRALGNRALLLYTSVGSLFRKSGVRCSSRPSWWRSNTIVFA